MFMVRRGSIIAGPGHVDARLIPSLQVEDILFKVPKNFPTRDSSLFETMFACGGVNEARPIVLPDVTAEEFEILMDFYHEWSFIPTATMIEGYRSGH